MLRLNKENIPVKIVVRENKKGIVAYGSECMNRNGLHIRLKYLKRMRCEQYHREIKTD